MAKDGTLKYRLVVAGKMPQQAKAAATFPDQWSWVPRTHMIEGKNQRPDAHELSCDLHMHAMPIAYAHISMPTINKWINK